MRFYDFHFTSFGCVSEFSSVPILWGHAVAQLVKGLRYKPEFFIDIILPAARPWGLTQPLTEMSTRNISWGVKAASA
jgi:hypothetical protein